MKYSIVQINRHVEVKCICGATCEKVSFEVADQHGNVETYGSSCIKSLLGIDTKHLENKRGIKTLKLDIIRSYEDTQSYQALFRQLRECDNRDPDNIGYKVVAKWIIADPFNNQLVELSGNKTVLNYNYKVTKSAFKQDQVIQSLELGSIIYDNDLK